MEINFAQLACFVRHYAQLGVAISDLCDATLALNPEAVAKAQSTSASEISDIKTLASAITSNPEKEVVAATPPAPVRKAPKRREDRVARRSRNDIDALELRLLEALGTKPDGLSAEDARKVVALERGPFGLLIRRVREKNLVRVEGEKRGTRYFRASVAAPPSTVTKVIRRRASDATLQQTNGVAAA